jgi:FecR protein
MSWHLVVAVVLSCFGMLLAPGSPVAWAADESCECAKSTCGPCEVEAGTTFYSSKCGPQNTRVKSCKKTTCEPVEDQKQCLALLNEAKPTLREISEEPNVRQIANMSAEAGQITDLQGEVHVTHSNGVKEKPRKRDPAFVGDIFETGAEASTKVTLRDGSEMTVAPNSKLRIDKVDVHDSTLRRQVALMVLAGKVRNRVTRTYKGENTYQVRTPTAVAGVRGTDFITSYLATENGWVSEVRTIEGLVRLTSTTEKGRSLQMDVPAGTYAVVKTDAAGLNPELSPLYKLKDQDFRQLQVRDFIADVAVAPASVATRSIASVANEVVCSAPAADFNQCSFTCENNALGEKRCRTDLPQVACVRRICRANGVWAEPTRLPASEAGRCESRSVVVGSCGTYW